MVPLERWFRVRGLPGEVAARVREAVESSACLSLVSAPADHFTVVTTATVIGTAVTRHWPCGTAGELVTRWRPRARPRSRDNFTGVSPRPVAAQVVGCSCRPGPVGSPGRRGWKGSASLRGYASGRQIIPCAALRQRRSRRSCRRGTAHHGGIGRGAAAAHRGPGAGQAQAADLQGELARPAVRPGQPGPDLGARSGWPWSNTRSAGTRPRSRTCRTRSPRSPSNVYENGVHDLGRGAADLGGPADAAQPVGLPHPPVLGQLPAAPAVPHDRPPARRRARRWPSGPSRRWRRSSSSSAPSARSLNKLIAQQKALVASLTPQQQQQTLGGGGTTTHGGGGGGTPAPPAPRRRRRSRSPTTSSAAPTSTAAPGRAGPGSTAPG